MSTLGIARSLMALLQPLTGERATGHVAVQPASTGPGGLVLAGGTYLLPVIDGSLMQQMLFKLARNPDTANGSWAVPAEGAIIPVLSNAGGDRYNLPAGTRFVLEPPLSTLINVMAQGDIVGGVDHDGMDGIKDIVQYETSNGPLLPTDAHRSRLKEFPAILVNYETTQPADGSSVSGTSRPTRTGTAKMLYGFEYSVTVFVSRTDSDLYRRDAGMAVVDRALDILSSRHNVDGAPVSNPGALQIVSVVRRQGAQDVYQKFYVYSIRVRALGSIITEDSRQYSPWLRTVMNVHKRETAGDELTIPLVTDVIIPMSTLRLTTDAEGDVLVEETDAIATDPEADTLDTETP